jgi:hypothetical protein
MSDEINIGTLSGGTNQIGGHGNVINPGSAVPGAVAGVGEQAGDSPAHGLYAFADIVGYSRLDARLQKMTQDYLASLLDASLAETGARPGQVAPQDQGDARLLRFPAGTDAAKVLAVMPRHINDELLVRNQDMAPHARMRVRLSFTMGVAAQGGTGLAGAAPIAVVRLANSAIFRRAMHIALQAQCGVILDHYLYSQYVRQKFRADISPDDYVSVHVSDPEKDFEEAAWIKLFGYSGEQVISLLA